MASRIEAGFKRVEDIAPLVDRSPRQIRYYEAGEAEPRLEFVRRWAEVTGKRLDYFSDGAVTRTVEPSEPPEHPGLDALAADAQALARHRIEPGEIERARHLQPDRPIETVAAAVAAIEFLRELGPPAGG